MAVHGYFGLVVCGERRKTAIFVAIARPARAGFDGSNSTMETHFFKYLADRRTVVVSSNEPNVAPGSGEFLPPPSLDSRIK